MVKQLTITNLVYYYYDEQNQSVELSWPLELGNPQGSVSLTVAPFEVWLLLLLGEQKICQRIIAMESFQPILGASQGLGLTYQSLFL